MKNQSLAEIQDFKEAYPKQIWGLFFSEMWERFCFYAMRGMLTYFMVYHLMMDSKVANLQYGATQAWIYAFTFIGGMFADKLLGFRRSLFWGGLLMITGSLLLAFDPKNFFFLGIAFTIVGTGFFKPNISSMVGQLYQENDPRRDAGFLLFYSGINIGAFLGGFVISIGKFGYIEFGHYRLLEGLIPQALQWNIAFGLAAFVMIISLLNFVLTQRNLGSIGLSPLDEANPNSKWKQIGVYIGTLALIPILMKMVANTQYTDWFMYMIGPFSILYLGYEMTKNTAAENKKLVAALVFILFSVIFWAIFEQAGGSLSLFASANINNKLLGFTFDPNIVNNSVNSLFVIIFAPLVGLLFIKMSKIKIEPNSILKFALAFIMLGLAFYTFYSIQFSANSAGKGSLNIFALGYLIVTFAELFLSPIGLSLMTKLAPYRLQGFMMGMWFLASAYGQYVAGLFGASISPDEKANNLQKMIIYTQGYKNFALYAIIAGILLTILSPFIKKLMQEIK